MSAEKMSIQEAVDLLKNVCASVQVNLQQHQLIQLALQTIQQKLGEGLQVVPKEIPKKIQKRLGKKNRQD